MKIVFYKNNQDEIYLKCDSDYLKIRLESIIQEYKNETLFESKCKDLLDELVEIIEDPRRR